MNFSTLNNFLNAVAQCDTWEKFQLALTENCLLLDQLCSSDTTTEIQGLRGKTGSRKKLPDRRIHEYLKALEGQITDPLPASPESTAEPASENWSAKYVVMFLNREYQRIKLLEETRKYQVSLEILLEPGVGFALVDMDLQVNFCNSVMENDFGLRQGGPLPEALGRLAKKKAGVGVPHFASDGKSKITTDYNFFNWNNKNFRVTVRLLDSQGSAGGQSFWAITIQPSVDAFSRTNRLAQRVGLSWREVEICSLLHDGLDPNEVSNRLFISKHTVKTYLKRIYRKCGVRSRAQLIALLNQYSGSKYAV